MNIFLDIDGTICTLADGEYELALPIWKRIRAVNRLYEQGHRITYWTARGSTTGIDWRGVTEEQLAEWGCKYHELRMGKPDYDLFICDKAVNAEHLEDVAKRCEPEEIVYGSDTETGRLTYRVKKG